MNDEFLRRQSAHTILPMVIELQETLNNCDFNLPLKFDGHRFFVFFDGIWLALENEYYLKYESSSKSIGSMLGALLDRFKIIPKIIIDIGANEGECTLVLANKYKHCRVYAIEPSSKTFERLRLNVESQDFSTANVILSNMALSNSVGFVTLTCGKDQENLILEPELAGELSDEVEIVSSSTFGHWLKIMGLNHVQIDCIKIDIEGHEPFLIEDLQANIRFINSALIECSKKASLEEYLNLFSIFHENKFLIIAEWGRLPLRNLEELEAYLKKLLYEQGEGAIDVFFIRN